MKRHNLKNCIHTLQHLRDAHCGQLNTSVVVELNRVIEDLTKIDESFSEETVHEIAYGDVLGIIATVIRLVSNIKDLMG